MCGFSGFISTTQSLFYKDPLYKNKFLTCAKKISHRGNEPLKSIFFEHVFLSHARLAFQDLTNGAQPMTSFDNEWFIIFNGEIYNYKELRSEIIQKFAYPFKTNSDTEVILAGFLCYQEKILEKLEGEYSFVITKKNGEEFFAARDFFGVKPLFAFCEQVDTQNFSIAKESFSFKTHSINFSSEIKGLFAQKEWDKNGFLRQITGLYEPIRTPFKHVIQVPGGSYLHGKKSGAEIICQLVLNQESIRHAQNNLEHISHTVKHNSYLNRSHVYEEFIAALKKSVTDRTVSEVELGVYLSGGIDSKSIASLLSEALKTQKIKTPLKSFTVGFDTGQGFDETEEAKLFARDFSLDFKSFKLNYEALNYAYPIAVYYSENIQPYTNGSAKWWLSNFTSKHVKGVLTGDGADELLCGYPSFRYASWWKFALRNRKGENVFDKLKNSPLGSSFRDSVYEKKFSEHGKNPWLSGSSHAGSGQDFFESLNMWGVPHPLFGQTKFWITQLLGAQEGMQWLEQQRESVVSWFTLGLAKDEKFLTDPNNTLLLWQNYFCKTHLPVQVLNWVGDRMEMANTLEGRTPFLSGHLRKFIANLDDNYFVRGFEEKSILRKSFQKLFPQNIKHVPKQKKQFNAPFLFLLQEDFHKKRILNKIKNHDILDQKHVENLITSIHNKNKNNFSQSYTQSLLQSLVSFTFVDDYVMSGQEPKRDLNYEQKILGI